MDQQEPNSRLTRRNVLIAGGGTAVAVGAFAVSPLSNPLVSEMRSALAGQGLARSLFSLANGTYEEWQSLVGSTFALGGGTTMRLTGVSPLQSTGTRPYSVARRQAFLGVFEPGARQSMASDLIYTATHPQYGPVQLFLTSAPGPRAPTQMYAVFN